MMVMLLGGLWHGAAWNFVIWGGIHGVMLGIERFRGKNSIYNQLPRPFRIAATFVILLFTWVFFRAQDLPSALGYCGSMLGIGSPTAHAALVGSQMLTVYHVAALLIAGVIVWCGVPTWDFTRRVTWPKAGLVVLLFLTAILMLVATSFHPFIYFIF